VDGVHTRVRLGADERLCCLVVGVRSDGAKELVALQDGYRESEESWACLLRDLKKRGMRAPVLVVGDGALGFWAAVRDVFPQTLGQRDWVHKSARACWTFCPRTFMVGPRRLSTRSLRQRTREAERAIEVSASLRWFEYLPKE
jgi:hypothetical protein